MKTANTSIDPAVTIRELRRELKMIRDSMTTRLLLAYKNGYAAGQDDIRANLRDILGLTEDNNKNNERAEDSSGSDTGSS